jgi:hypothetical protein
MLRLTSLFLVFASNRAFTRSFPLLRYQSCFGLRMPLPAIVPTQSNVQVLR